MQKNSILFVGCGKMGTAMLSSFVANKIFKTKNIYVIEPHLDSEIKTQYNINLYDSLEDLTKDNFDIVIFAVKPQILPDILPKYKKFNDGRCLFISIAAGKSLDFFTGYLGYNAKIIRTMPNIAMLANHAIVCAIGNQNITEKDQALVHNCFSSTGNLIWLNNENDMHQVTAISGSGPAYFFYFCEALIKAAIDIGLNENIAHNLVIETFIGSAKLMSQLKQQPKELRQMVTSPKGTTEAALQLLMTQDFDNIVTKSVEAAKSRSEELAYTIFKN